MLDEQRIRSASQVPWISTASSRQAREGIRRPLLSNCCSTKTSLDDSSFGPRMWWSEVVMTDATATLLKFWLLRIGVDIKLHGNSQWIWVRWDESHRCAAFTPIISPGLEILWLSERREKYLWNWVNNNNGGKEVINNIVRTRHHLSVRVSQKDPTDCIKIVRIDFLVMKITKDSNSNCYLIGITNQTYAHPHSPLVTRTDDLILDQIRRSDEWSIYLSFSI